MLAQWLKQPDFQRRAIAAARRWVAGKSLPEPLTGKNRSYFVIYGILADVYGFILNLFIVFLVGFLLSYFLKGTGLVFFAVFLILRFEDQLRRFFMKMPVFRWLGVHVFTSEKLRRILVPLLIIGGLTVLYFIPCSYEAGGECEIEPAFRENIRTEITGRIESVLTEEGKQVAKGEVLITLSQRDIRQEIEVSMATLEREQAELELLKKMPKSEAIAKAQQQVKFAATNLKYSQSKLQRFEELYKKEHISDQEYEEIKKQRDGDRETLELAGKNLELVSSGSTPEQIKAQLAEVSRLKTVIAHLEDKLKRTKLSSPISGVVATMYLKEKLGELVTEGELIAIIENNSNIVLRILIPEEYVAEIKKNSEVWAKLWSFPGKVFNGKVLRVSTVVIERTENELNQAMIEQKFGTIRSINLPGEKIVSVVAELSADEKLLKTGMKGCAKIAIGKRHLGYILLSPVIRFFQVRVWSWLP